MIDTKEKVVSDILSSMSDCLDDYQMTRLQNTLLLNFYDLEITIPERAVGFYENKDEKLLEQYYLALKMEGKSPKTIKRYLLQLKLMLSHVQKNVLDITTEDLRYYLLSYQQKNKVTNTTLSGMQCCISAFFNWLEINEYIQKSPAKKLKPIKKDTIKESAFTVGELEKMMLVCDNSRDKALLSLAYETAARADEISRIKMDEIDLTHMEVLLHGKGSKDRVSYFSEKTVLYISEYLKERDSDSEYLFYSARSKDRGLTNAAIELIFKKIGKKADIPGVHPHRFRVTRISHLAARGMPLQDIQQIAGHVNIDTTMGYVRIDKKNVKNSYERAI